MYQYRSQRETYGVKKSKFDRYYTMIYVNKKYNTVIIMAIYIIIKVKCGQEGYTPDVYGERGKGMGVKRVTKWSRNLTRNIYFVK